MYICDFLKWMVLGGTGTHKKHLCAFTTYNEGDYRGYLGLDERFSMMPIHQADTYLSRERTEMCLCGRYKIRRRAAGDGAVMVLWVTAGRLIVSSALPWPPMSAFVSHTYRTVVSYQWKISHKATMIHLICGDDSMTTAENDNHFNLLSKFLSYIKTHSRGVMEDTFQCSLIALRVVLEMDALVQTIIPPLQWMDTNFS